MLAMVDMNKHFKDLLANNVTCIYIDCNGHLRDRYEWLYGLQVVRFVYFDFQLAIIYITT